MSRGPARRPVPLRPRGPCLQRVVAADVRRVTGYQDFVDTAPLDLIYVADHAHEAHTGGAARIYASAAAGAMAQNVYLYCASAGLSTVIRAWIDRQALAQAMSLGTDQQNCFRRPWGPARHERRIRSAAAVHRVARRGGGPPGRGPGHCQRQQRRLAQLLDVALRDSRLYQELLPRAAARTPLQHCPWSRAASSWSALTTG